MSLLYLGIKNIRLIEGLQSMKQYDCEIIHAGHIALNLYPSRMLIITIPNYMHALGDCQIYPLHETLSGT
jgi:hypothetical protein